MPDRHIGSVVVQVRGPLSPADHVYAHDRVAQLCRAFPGEALRCTVTIVADGHDQTVTATAEVRTDGPSEPRVAYANAEASSLGGVVDLLHDRLRLELETLAAPG